MKKAFKNFPSLGRRVKGEGFTLAEVLITLMIIGIVAALTIPSVISNYQQQEFKTGLKKAVSVLNNAIQMNITQDGETPYDRNIKYEEDNDIYQGSLIEYLTRHMSVMKHVQGNEYIKSGHDEINDKYFTSASNSAFYTTDGMRFEIKYKGGPLNSRKIVLHETNLMISDQGMFTGCGSYGLKNNPNNTTETPCFVLVDVNGDKKPTVYGANIAISDDRSSYKNNYTYPSPTDKKLMDIFPILITEDRAIPFGVVAQRAMYSK